MSPQFCTVTGGPAYFVEVDWNDDGDYLDTYDNVSSDLTMNTPITIGYGRDNARALSPVSAGVMRFEICDPDAIFSPENPDSPIVNEVGPGRMARQRVTLNGTEYILFTGRIDSIDTVSSKYSQNVPVTAMDALAYALQSTEISTALYSGLKTGEAINIILDEVGWPLAARRIDTGTTTIPWWWEERTSAFQAVAKLVFSEGPPAIMYIDPSTNEFVFEDRQHRILNNRSQNIQATFCVDLTSCMSSAAPCPTGSIDYTDPFVYDSGIKDIVNSVTIPIIERQAAPLPIIIWETESPFNIANSSTVLNVVTELTDPFTDATVVVDAFGAPSTSLSVTMSRTSGQSTALFLNAIGSITVNKIQVFARPVAVTRTYQITNTNTASIAQHGRRSYPNEIVWASPGDAIAVADIIVSRYAFKQTTVSIRVVNCDDVALEAMLSLVLGDRVRIINSRYRLDDSFIIERIERDIIGLGRIHATTFYCERVFAQPLNAFTFDVPALGFDNGVFGYNAVIDASTLFIFGEAGHGFDDGEFAY